MPRLGARDLRAVLDFVTGLYAARSLDAFARYGNVALARLVPCDINGFNEINPRARRVRYVLEPAEADIADGEAALARHIHEHPIVAYYRRTESRPVVKLSDFLSRRQLHDRGLYTEFFRRMRIEHMIVAALPLRPPLQAGFSLCRAGRDFTERDRLVLELLRPHLAQAYRNAEAAESAAATASWLEAGLERAARGLVGLGADGRVRAMTDRARRWLAEYWGPPARRGHGLPAALRDWVRRHHADLGRLSGPRAPLSVERDGKRLVVRLVSDGAAALLLLEEQRIEPDAAALAALGLSRREAEVLAWVAQGKTNPEIGRIAGLSARTVGKHLERVYAKLGVETRTAAARIALSV